MAINRSAERSPFAHWKIRFDQNNQPISGHNQFFSIKMRSRRVYLHSSVCPASARETCLIRDNRSVCAKRVLHQTWKPFQGYLCFCILLSDTYAVSTALAISFCRWIINTPRVLFCNRMASRNVPYGCGLVPTWWRDESL